MVNLSEPNLKLFSYSLKQGLGVSETEIKNTYQKFLINLSDKLRESFNLASLPTKSEFINLHKNFASIPFTGDLNKYRLEGEYCRWIREDNYQLVFDGYIKDWKCEENAIISFINTIKKIIPEQLLTTNTDKFYQLGQTWMLSGWGENNTDEEIKDLAKKAYQTIFNKDDNPQGYGKFIGGKIFEFCGENPTENNHLLVIFYPDDKKVKDAEEKLIKNWIDLLCYRHKIIWAYNNSQELKNRLVNNYNEIIALRSFSKLNLSELKLAMEKLSNFVISLNYLEMQLSTITINLEKYKDKLQEMTTKSKWSDDIKFLEKFTEQVEQKYLKQITKDIANFRPGLEVLKSLTDTIRGTVEIRQAESDRTFQAIVGIVGVGLGTGSMVASTIANSPKELQANSNINNIINYIPFIDKIAPGNDIKLVLGYSITSGVFASLVTFLIIFGFRSIFRK